MSVFRVYAGTADDQAEFRGTKTAGYIFADIFNDTTNPKNIFENLIKALVHTTGHTVTYSPKVAGTPEYDIVHEEYKGKDLFYYVKNGKEKQVKLKSEQDDPTDNIVNMAVPSRPVEYDDDYLINAVELFKDASLADADKQAFLLGMLLLKRCR